MRLSLEWCGGAVEGCAAVALLCSAWLVSWQAVLLRTATQEPLQLSQTRSCMGLVSLAQQALEQSSRKVPIKYVVVGVQGDIKQEEWLSS